MFSGKQNLRRLLSTSTLALLGLLALPSTGRAVDLSPDTTRYLSDPSFLPLEGQVYSETSYAHVDVSGDFTTVAGFKAEHFSSNVDRINQDFAYGITDRLTLSASAAYRFDSQHYTTPFGGSSSLENDDFENPTFGVTYRAIDQSESPVSLDLAASYSPAAVDATSQSGGVSLFVNRELKFLTIQGEASVSYVDAYNGRETQFATDHDGYWNYLVGLRSQVRLTDRFAVNSGVTYSNSTDIKYDGGAFRDSTDGTWSPYVALSYAVVPNRVDVAFEYDHDFIGDEHRSGGINGTWSNSDNLYAVHLRLLF
jgi:hypothetical protein